MKLRLSRAAPRANSRSGWLTLRVFHIGEDLGKSIIEGRCGFGWPVAASFGTAQFVIVAIILYYLLRP